jgi:spermidine/putrescine transport system permease protein
MADSPTFGAVTRRLPRPEVSSRTLLRAGTIAYLVLFFGYMFLPLIFMILAAFNTPKIPQAIPMQGFTLQWFQQMLGNSDLWSAVLNSIVIGLGVVAMTVCFGLAGALLITRMHSKAQTLVYAILVSPLLTPGIILGVSTLIFWNNFGVPGGMFLAAVAQATFISAYTMLLFMARLQRFDYVLEEAALDLGASYRQVFFKVTLPFLKPTIITAAVLSFLASIDNYNTTVFAIGPDTTLTIKIASMVRLGLTPEVNALAVLLIFATVALAVAYEVKRRREKAQEELAKERAKQADERLTRAQAGLATAET